MGALQTPRSNIKIVR